MLHGATMFTVHVGFYHVLSETGGRTDLCLNPHRLVQARIMRGKKVNPRKCTSPKTKQNKNELSKQNQRYKNQRSEVQMSHILEHRFERRLVILRQVLDDEMRPPGELVFLCLFVGPEKSHKKAAKKTM